MSKMELIDVEALKSRLVRLYSDGDEEITETDRTVNRVFNIIELLPVIKLELPNIGTEQEDENGSI